jgi:hypothetical protein
MPCSGDQAMAAEFELHMPNASSFRESVRELVVEGDVALTADCACDGAGPGDVHTGNHYLPASEAAGSASS